MWKQKNQDFKANLSYTSLGQSQIQESSLQNTKTNKTSIAQLLAFPPSALV